MAAIDHISPRQAAPRYEQGKLFMKPSELAALPSADPIMRTPEGSAIKLAESKVPKGTTYQDAGLHPRGFSMHDSEVHGAGVYEALKAGKINAPVSVWRGQVDDGNHRIHAGVELERQGHRIMLPVTFSGYKEESIAPKGDH